MMSGFLPVLQQDTMIKNNIPKTISSSVFFLLSIL